MDAVAMAFGRWLLDKPTIEHFRIKGASLVRVAQNHVHHFVIPRVTERFGHRPKSKRSAENLRMKLALNIVGVDGTQLRSERAGQALEFVKKAVEKGEG